MLDQWKEGQALYLEFLQLKLFLMEESCKDLAIICADTPSDAALNSYRQCRGHVGCLEDLLELDFESIEAHIEQARNRKENYAKYRDNDAGD